MKNRNFCISRNLTVLRQIHKYSQEEVAEKIGVSRQAVAKWESGETAPDLINCDALAELYNVSVDDLIHFDQSKEKIEIPPKGKHIFGRQGIFFILSPVIFWLFLVMKIRNELESP